MIVASIESRPSRGSILMFWMTPATRYFCRGATRLRGVTPSRVELHRARFSARVSSGAFVKPAMNRFSNATTGKYGSIPP